MGLSPMELVIVGLVVLLVFGTKRLPDLGAGLGQAISNFRKSYKDGLAIDVTPQNNGPANAAGNPASNPGIRDEAKSAEDKSKN